MDVLLHKLILNRCIPSVMEGIHVSLLVLFTLFSLNASAQETALLKRFQRADTTMNFKQIREMYFYYSSTEHYRKSLSFTSLDTLTTVRERPLSLQALFDAAIYMKKRGKKKAMERYALQFWMLGEMIYREFVGDAEDPYPILYPSDEHLFLYNWNHIDGIVSEKEKPEYDIIECTVPPDWIDFFYFRRF